MWCGCCVTFLTLLVTLVASAVHCPHERQLCDWEPWRQWSSCSNSCGSGTRSRVRALCCKVDESYDTCRKECGLANDSPDRQEPCDVICPTAAATTSELPPTTPPTTPVPECLATSADIVFVIDSSRSIGGENFGKIKDFVYSMVNRLDIDPDLTRVGVLVFSDAPKWYFKLGDYSSKLDVEKAIMRIPYIPGSTQTSKAMETLINEGFQLNRSAVPAIAVVITDGLSRYPSLTRVRAEILRKMGVRVYAIGVGNNTNHEELFNMASLPEESTTPSMTTEEPQTTATVSECVDTVDCLPYGMDMCTDYAPWAGSHCPLFCGFCEGPKLSAAPCVDAINKCASYGAYVCTDKAYIAWAQTNCRKFCGICTASTTSELPPTTPTTTPVPICEDTIDNCVDYKHACADPKFRGFLEARCPATCRFCQSYQIFNETLVNGLRCPEWNVPVECTLVAEVPGCCPLPRCPHNGHVYTVTVEKVFP